LRAAQLAPLALNEEDTLVMLATLKDFNDQFDALLNKQNAAVKEAATNLTTPTYDTFLADRDAIVSVVKNTLKGKLSSEAFDRLQKFIEGEKKNMRISPVTK